MSTAADSGVRACGRHSRRPRSGSSAAEPGGDRNDERRRRLIVSSDAERVLRSRPCPRSSRTRPAAALPSSPSIAPTPATRSTATSPRAWRQPSTSWRTTTSVWVGVLQANTEGQTNPVFCAGADLKAINSGNAASLNTKRGGFAGYAYRERKKPVIVAVDGLATAGGCEIVLACDLVVATTRSAFGLAEVKRNLVAGAGGLFRLPRAIGRAAAMEVILTGEPLPAAARLRARTGQPLSSSRARRRTKRSRLAAQITADAPMAVWASRKVVLASADRRRRHAQDDDRRRVRWQGHAVRGHRRRVSRHSSRSAPRNGRVADRSVQS